MHLPCHTRRDRIHRPSTDNAPILNLGNIRYGSPRNPILRKLFRCIICPHREHLDHQEHLSPVPTMPAPVLRTSQAPEQQITLPFRMKPTEGNQIAAVDTKGGMEEETRSRRINAAEHQERLSTKPKAVASLREELLTHSRYIRDHLFPALSRAPKLSQSDLATLNSIFKLLRSLAVTFDILRFSRMEKALQLIVANGASVWPTEVVIQAEYTLRKWEDKLGHGSLKNLRANLWGPGGRLEGIRRIKDSRHRDDV